MQGVRSQITQDWLQTALGEALLQQESRVVEEVLDGIFGEHCLQLGAWGDSRTFLRFTRTQRCCLIAEDATGEPCAIAELHRLPVESDSIDAVLLPHTLDYSDRPHAILREVDRVLRKNGHLVILGFKPAGLWGLRRLIPGAAHRGQSESIRPVSHAPRKRKSAVFALFLENLKRSGRVPPLHNDPKRAAVFRD